MRDGIFELAFVAGDGGVADGARDVSFPVRWAGGGTEAVMDGERKEEYGADENDNQCEDDSLQGSHVGSDEFAVRG